MKNYFLKAICLVAVAMSSLPVIANDYLKIYFKDGHTERHYMKLVESISATKYDLEGTLHSDYQMQQIVMKDTTYSYYIADIDSMSFTKVNEEQVKKNIETVTSGAEAALQSCKTVEEMEQHLDELQSIEGVESATMIPSGIVVQVRDWRKIYYIIPPEPVDPVEIDNQQSSRTRSILMNDLTIKTNPSSVANTNSPIKIALANTFDNNLTRGNQTLEMKALNWELNSLGFDSRYIDYIDLPFFTDDICEYDHVILFTHGYYDPNTEAHAIVTSVKIKENQFDQYIDDQIIEGIIDQNDIDDFFLTHTVFGEGIEIKLPSHLTISENFIRKQISKRKHNNPSIFYNGACASLAGHEDIDRNVEPYIVKGNINMANAFLDKENGFDIYIGYTDENVYGILGATNLYRNMLNGQSEEVAFSNILPIFLCDNFLYLHHAYLTDICYNMDAKTSPRKMFLVKTKTKDVSPIDIVNYSINNKFKITGYTTMLNPLLNTIICGFLYKIDGEVYPVIQCSKEYNIGELKEDNVSFSASIDLKPGQELKYRAFTYDGVNYNWGEERNFKSEQLAELTLSTTGPISLGVGESTTVEITSGNGDYTIENKAPSTISVKKNDNILTITALSAGPGTIIVTDNKTGQTKEITVEVKDSESSSGWVNLISNGDMEGTDASCFFQRTASSDPYPSSISDGVGKNNSRGIKVEATAKQSQHYDNQFWFRMTEPISVDTKYRFSFDYRADKNARINMEIHNEPAVYNYYTDWETECIPEWRTFTAEGIVSSNDSPSNKPFHSIAINLSWCSEANNYYFDNIKFEIYKEGEEPVADLALSSTSPISLKVGESKTITITSGSGNYSVKSSDDKVASVSRNGNTVTIKAVSAGPATITITDIKSGKTKSIEVEVKATSGVISYTACPDTHHPHWIDLGLPSGTKWSCCNEGASAPEEFGEYYEYGEVLTAPSQIQGEELIKNTTYSWGTLNGVNGGLFTGKNGGAIFLPATGSNTKGKLEYVGVEGHYWSLVSTYIWTLGFNSDYPEMWTGFYYGGVRGIRRTVRSVSK
jgi:hypothetical protein